MGFAKSIHRPIVTMVRREPVVFWASFVSSCILGQLGIFVGTAIATDPRISVGDVIGQNLASGNMYTFAVAILVAACSALCIEYVDGTRGSRVPQLPGQKVAAAGIAIVLVVFQASLAGVLLKDSLLLQASAVNVTQPAGLTSPSSVLQLSLWIISMVVAQYLICLTRMHLYPEEVAEMVREEASNLADSAHEKDVSKDGEVL